MRKIFFLLLFGVVGVTQVDSYPSFNQGGEFQNIDEKIPPGSKYLTLLSTCYNTFTGSTCWVEVQGYKTKEDLISVLRSQDDRTFPHYKAFKIEPMEYELEVKREDKKIQVEQIQTIETKREIKFK